MSLSESAKSVLFRSEWLTHNLRALRALGHYLGREPHEADFNFLAHARYRGVFMLDLGANIGHSALSALKVQPGMHVLSIEANPACESGLKMTKRLLGDRFEYRIVGVGNTAGEMPFYVPFRSSRMLLEEGTFDRTTLDSPVTCARLGRPGVDYEVRQLSVPMVTVDSLHVKPAVIKMDLQGLEMQALLSMQSTIEQCWPDFMIEVGECHAEVERHLTRMGYQPHHWADGQLHPGARDRMLNAIFTKP